MERGLYENLKNSIKYQDENRDKMSVKKGVLKSFNSADYTATVQMTGSDKAFLEDIAVARNLPEAEMTSGRRVTVVFFDEHNAKEAVLVAVYT